MEELLMRLIDADALIEDIKSFWDWDSIDGITSTTVLKQTITDISHAPTIDAVPVVRCKDCMYSETDDMGFYYCVHDIIGGYGATLDVDTFCSYGEREDNE